MRRWFVAHTFCIKPPANAYKQGAKYFFFHAYICADIPTSNHLSFIFLHVFTTAGEVATTGVCGFSLIRNASFFTF